MSETPTVILARRKRATLILLLAAGVGSVLLSWIILRSLTSPPALPKLLAPAVPDRCRQVVLVLSPETKSVPARLWMLERGHAGKSWKTHAGPIPVSLGRSGLGWGEGEHAMPAPDGFPIKQEGDGCSPAGVFQIPFAFGYAPANEVGRVRLPYVPVTDSLTGVDDVKSKYYNQVVDAATVTKDWESNE